MRTATKTTLFAALSTLLALGAANAYAAENTLVLDTGEQRMWQYEKTAVTEEGALEMRGVVVRRDELPELIVPLNTNALITAEDTPNLATPVRYSRDDLRQFDITGDDPVFIGSQGVSEFDTLDAQRERAAYPNQLGVDPLTPVAGAGLATSF